MTTHTLCLKVSSLFFLSYSIIFMRIVSSCLSSWWINIHSSLCFLFFCLQPSKKQKNEPSAVDPWSVSSRNTLLETINDDLRKFAVSSHTSMYSFSLCHLTLIMGSTNPLQGYHKSNKVYYGKVALTSSLHILRNKVIELGITQIILFQSCTKLSYILNHVPSLTN